MTVNNDLRSISHWPRQETHIIGETLVGLKTEAKVFWQEIREWLASSTTWKKVKIGDAEISREKISSLATLNLPIAPSLLGAINNEITEKNFSELINVKIEPIAKAVYLGDIELVKALLREGACANLVIEGEGSGSFEGFSLLDIAIVRNRLEILSLLLENGAAKPDGPKINLKVSYLKTVPVVLKSLVQHGLFEAIGQKDLAGTPFHWAVSHGNLEEIQFCLDVGGKIDCLDSCKRTPLQLAVKENKLEVILFLLDRGADPTLAIKDTCDPSLIKILLQYGADPHVKISKNFSLLQSVVRSGNIDIFEMLVQAYKDKAHLIGILTEFLSQKVPFLKEDGLTIITSQDQIQWVRILLDVIDCNGVKIKGLPLLHCVALYNEDLAISILKRGGDPNVVTSTGISALHLAAMLNLRSLASALVEMKADLALKDYSGATALNHALNYYKTHGLALKLIEQGALAHANHFYLYNSFKLLRITWLSSTVTTTPFLHAQWKEMNLGKLCSHLFEVDGCSELIPLESNTDTISFDREGMLSPRWLIKKVGQCTKKMSDLNPQLIQLITSLCEFAAEPTHSNSEYLARIQEDKPVLIMTATNIHSYNILIYKNGYVVCDGNFKVIQIQRYEPKFLTEEIIGRLRYECSFADPKQSADSLRTSVETILQVRNEREDAVYQSDAWTSQKMGICNWKSFEMAIHALALLEKEPITPFITSWILGLKLELASQYLSNVEKKLFQPDQLLIHTMITDLEQRKANSDLETCNKIDVICASCRALIDSVRSEKALLKTPKEHLRDACFYQFIRVPIPDHLYYRAILPR